jgi:hypothetical protein
MMSEAIVTRIDEMGDRIDGLEKSIADLMAQAGVERESADATLEDRPVAPSKAVPEHS